MPCQHTILPKSGWYCECEFGLGMMSSMEWAISTEPTKTHARNRGARITKEHPPFLLLIHPPPTGTILPPMRKTTPSSAPSHPPPPDPDNYLHLHLGNLREPNASEKPFYRLPKPERATIHSGLVAKHHYLSISLADNPDLLTYLHRSSLTVSQRAEYHRRLRSTTNQRPSCGSPDHTKQPPPQQHIQPKSPSQ